MLRQKLVYTGSDTGPFCCACGCHLCLLAVCIALPLLITTSSAISYVRRLEGEEEVIADEPEAKKFKEQVCVIPTYVRCVMCCTVCKTMEHQSTMLDHLEELGW